MTVFENLLVGAAFGGARSEAACYEDCHGILARTGLLEKANRPAGSLTLLERKRLEMARALAARPRALMRIVSRPVVINSGRKLAEGAPQEVMASAAVREVDMGIGAA